MSEEAKATDTMELPALTAEPELTKAEQEVTPSQPAVEPAEPPSPMVDACGAGEQVEAPPGAKPAIEPTQPHTPVVEGADSPIGPASAAESAQSVEAPLPDADAVAAAAESPPAARQVFAPPPRTGSTTEVRSGQARSPEVMARWEQDMGVMHDSIRLLLCNRISEANERLSSGAAVVKARKIDFSAGDHDLRGAFAFVSAIMSLILGLASLEKDQLDTVLQRVWTANELLAEDGDWAGKKVLQGLCLLIAGVVEIMQMAFARGVWHILRSWGSLRHLESEALVFQGHESSCVRSTALLALGAFNLLTSVLPPQAMKAAGWVTGFKGGREVAEQQLRACWQEEGILAPIAGLLLAGVAVDVSSFLGELAAERKPKLEQASQVLEWAKISYPDSFFFALQDASYRSAVRDLPGSLSVMAQATGNVQNLPAFIFLAHVRVATFHACSLQWAEAAESYLAAVDVHRSVSRRAFCPTLAMNAHLCYMAGGDYEKAAEALEVAETYKTEKKKWSGVDKVSLEQMEKARRALAALSEGKEIRAVQAAEGWRPILVMSLKICVIYRGAHFMSPEGFGAFLELVRAETESCGESDPDNQVLGLWIQAEAMRQNERWDEALQLSAEVLQLAPRLSVEARKGGSLQFSALVAAYAHYAKGNVTVAKDMIAKVDLLGTDHFFRRSVDFKVTHLRRLVGMELQDTFLEVQIGGRSKRKLVADVPEGVNQVEWDFTLTDYSVSVVVAFRADGAASACEVQRLDKHDADAGPINGSYEVPGPGRLEVIIDNSFSMLRGKTLHCRTQPNPVKLRFE